MSVDQNALTDRLYADALSMCIRSPQRFYTAKTTHTWEEIEEFLRQRALVHMKDLGLSEATMERAIEDVKSAWEKSKLTRENTCRDVSLLHNAALMLLQPNGTEMLLKVARDEPGREILRWRFVSFLLPPTILIAAATRDKLSIPKSVRILDPSMAPDFPVAQNHLHHAAITSFEGLWVSLRRRALLEIGSFVKAVQNEKAFCPQLHKRDCPGGKSKAKKEAGQNGKIARAKHMAEWADLIRQAFIARRVLESHLWHNGTLEACSNPICEKGKATLRFLFKGRVKPYSFFGTAYPWWDELRNLARRYRKCDAEAVLRRKSQLTSDFIQMETADERRLLARAFVKLHPQEAESGDDLYEILFLQYLRVKTAVFKLLVHPPGERGLERFLEYFSQIKVYAGETDHLTPPRPDEPSLNVQATEYRVAPDAWRTRLRYRPTVEEETTDSPPTESAWLIHFKRTAADKLLPLFSTAVRDMEADAAEIAAALDQEPKRLRKLRGIDLCGIEGTQPLWVSVPTLRYLRRRSQRTAARRPALRLDPLRLTVHAGEDFHWLTSGVRAIAEPFKWELIERGDRIGHGIAVTLEPKDWWDWHAGQVMTTTRMDRFLDLAFLVTYTDIKEYRRTPDQTQWLQIELTRAAEQIWPKLTSQASGDILGTAICIWDLLGRRTTRRLMEELRWIEPPVPIKNDLKNEIQAKRWIHNYLWNRSIQERAQETIRMKVDDDENAARTNSKRNELDLLIEARKRLIHEIARWQVCIESNPSSNLVVGSLDAMSSQDFLQSRPTNEKGRGEETLTWTISTDDPITFSTTLADEYAYAWAGMVLREKNPYDPAYARALLDEAAQTSMRMRFTLRDPTGPRADAAFHHDNRNQRNPR